MNQFSMRQTHELRIDLFAGGGGASTGIEQATGELVDIAVNHDADAIAMHQANHPDTEHHVSDVFEISPMEVTKGRPVGLLWASPDCKHFSKAKGGKPVSKKTRSLAWVVIKWAKLARPRVIALENVEEFKKWGPLTKDDKPCPDRVGQTFRQWVAELERLGYRVEWRELRACDYGAPTTRKRLFLVARCDGLPIVWPKPSHGTPDNPLVKRGKLLPWRTAADIIDWRIPVNSIFMTKEEGKKAGCKRPLADNTMRRIARGVERYVLGAAEPFIAPNVRGGLVVPSIVPIANYGGGQVAANDAGEPLRTITANPKGGSHALVSAFLAKHYDGNYTGAGIDARSPTDTVTTQDHHALVTSSMIKFRGSNVGSATDEPVPTITAGGTHIGEVRAFLMKYYGAGEGSVVDGPLHTVTTKDRMGLVTVAGTDYQIVDIGMRMLSPRELFRAQGFPDDYVIEFGADGRKLSKAAQVRMCGNSVCPPLARAIIEANVGVTQRLVAA
ncbi:MAG: DNA cytosine methyltransferase [Thiotrichales bacterium]|nr:MAG: DNA cytosine methyltransferase [Thiotrichales bacterium]